MCINIDSEVCVYSIDSEVCVYSNDSEVCVLALTVKYMYIAMTEVCVFSYDSDVCVYDHEVCIYSNDSEVCGSLGMYIAVEVKNEFRRLKQEVVLSAANSSLWFLLCLLASNKGQGYKIIDTVSQRFACPASMMMSNMCCMLGGGGGNQENFVKEFERLSAKGLLQRHSAQLSVVSTSANDLSWIPFWFCDVILFPGTAKSNQIL